MAPKKVWSLSDAASADDVDRPRFFISIRKGESLATYDRTGDGRKVRMSIPAVLYYEVEPSAPPEDCPWAGMGLVVSSRLRSIVEEMDPNAAQFLPVTIELLNKQKLVGQYFLMNILQEVDCIDEEGSTVVQACVVRARVPDHCHVFRVKHKRLGDRIASDEFRKRVIREGITGIQFYNQLQCAK
jgi:hypothetical protein